MRNVLLAALTMALAPHAQAQQFTSPGDLLSTLYEENRSGRSVDNYEPYFSDQLMREMSGARVTSGVLQRLGLDPISGSNRPGLITVFNLATVESGPISAETIASFWNAGVPAGGVKGDADGSVVVAQAPHYRMRLSVLAARNECFAKDYFGRLHGAFGVHRDTGSCLGQAILGDWLDRIVFDGHHHLQMRPLRGGA